MYEHENMQKKNQSVQCERSGSAVVVIVWDFRGKGNISILKNAKWI